MNKQLASLILFFAIFAVSCSNDDEPQIPTNAISLNMMAGDSETTISGSDVFINASLNFESSYCGIADLGKRGGFNQNPNLSQIAQEVAVTPGHYYQITLANNFRTVAGVRAYPIKTNYYNVYVDSWIYDKDKDIAGAKVSFTECYPEIKQLPKWDEKIVVNKEKEYDIYNNSYYTVSYSFPKGCMIDDAVGAYYSDGYRDLTDRLDFKINGNQMVLRYPDLSNNDPYVELLVRFDNVYTRVYLNFK
ncbi:MAG: DUF5036 family protein [Bacteroides sp.]|nr:DUF5036 family protein [Bacteroides sp.]